MDSVISPSDRGTVELPEELMGCEGTTVAFVSSEAEAGGGEGLGEGELCEPGGSLCQLSAGRMGKATPE